MISRWRTLAAGLGVVGGLVLYAAAVVTAADWLPDHWTVDLAYYLVAGIAWIFPAILLIRWSKRDDLDAR